jgi:hypothetical protein
MAKKKKMKLPGEKVGSFEFEGKEYVCVGKKVGCRKCRPQVYCEVKKADKAEPAAAQALHGAKRRRRRRRK